MASPTPEPQPLKIRTIRRKQVQQYLAISAFIATQLITGCDMAEEEEPTAEVEPKVPALFYETTAQCEADATKLTATASPPPPTPNPGIPVTDCAKQIAAARQEHDRHAPVYQSLTDCKADDIQCEPTPYGYDTYGYRPSYGGAYFFSSMGNYRPYTVYRGLNGRDLITPQGQVLASPGLGLVSMPQSLSIASPPRPPGYAAVGTIKGRNVAGFGSTYKNTGSGGK
ncbi:MAG: DUF1190 domain-containing protein [Alkalinema sp. RU_4_3]|nr:DUF1190 domain-containing protein [Alkalinema sp. RU_4_3]